MNTFKNERTCLRVGVLTTYLDKLKGESVRWTTSFECRIIGEHALVFGHFAQLAVVTHDGVSCVNDLSDRGCKCKVDSQTFPVFLPRADHDGISLAPLYLPSGFYRSSSCNVSSHPDYRINSVERPVTLALKLQQYPVRNRWDRCRRNAVSNCSSIRRLISRAPRTHAYKLMIWSARLSDKIRFRFLTVTGSNITLRSRGVLIVNSPTGLCTCLPV